MRNSSICLTFSALLIAGCTLTRTHSQPKRLRWTVLYTTQGVADSVVAGTAHYRITGLPRRTDSAALIVSGDTVQLQWGANCWVGGHLRHLSDERSGDESVWLEWLAAGRTRTVELGPPHLIGRQAAP